MTSRRRSHGCDDPVIDAQVTSQGLDVVVTGSDAWLLALRPRWQVVVPLEHVRQAKVR